MTKDKHPISGASSLPARAPQVEKMRDPLKTDWNLALEQGQSGRAGTEPGYEPTEEEVILSQIDFKMMNEVLENWLEVVGIPCAIIDLKGHVLAASKWQRICMDFHRVNPDTLQRCLESDTLLARQMQEGKNYAIYKCRNGLTDCASPIIVEGHHIANFFTGQFLLAPADVEYFMNQAATFGFMRNEYLDALADVPIVPEERLPAILNMLAGLARMVASQSLGRQRAMAAHAVIERKVEERTAELAALNQELEAFAYSVSHDLRAPLRAIDGFARMIESRHGAELPAEARKYLGTIVGSAAQMNQLITDLLDFSRARQSDMKHAAIDMQGMAHAVIEELSPSFAGRHVVFDVGDLPPAEGDLAMIRQVLLNLISNAIKFTRIREEARIAISADRRQEETVYCVADNGVGFSMKFVGRLFRVFQRLHAQAEYEGTGVGLALVKRIMERHGGRVWAESEEGKGTSIYFALPVKKA